MASFIFKGVALEQMLGSEAYAAMVALILVLSHGLYVIVAACAAQIIGWQGPMRSCAIGFSAVIFGLKVILLQKQGQGERNVWGMRVQNRWVPWAELIVIQVVH